ncbi:MAG: hypothetical protein JW809_07170 [Pirellulales bacterium]|nr:hypothetical protein [Pirellulales bacterium]
MTVQSATVDVYGQQGAQATTSDAMRNLGTDDFINLMITELQNQDPMNPMDTTQMLQQIGQIREISSNDRLSESLDAMLLGQNLATAANLIGQSVVAMDDSGKMVTGGIDRAVIEDGKAKLHLIQRIAEHYDSETGELVPEATTEHVISLANVAQILADDEDLALMAQKVAAAGELVGRSIVGVASDGEVVTGTVDQIALEDGSIKLMVGSHRVDLADLTHVIGESDSENASTEENTSTEE